MLYASRDEISIKGPLNVHWTVKKRYEIIELLNSQRFKRNGWLVEGTRRWLGEDIDLPEDVTVKWII